MLKALFLDLDDTLCDTSSANEQAKQLMAAALEETYGKPFDGQGFSQAYMHGVYRNWTDKQRAAYTPIIAEQSESVFPSAVNSRLVGKTRRGKCERCAG